MYYQTILFSCFFFFSWGGEGVRFYSWASRLFQGSGFTVQGSAASLVLKRAWMFWRVRVLSMEGCLGFMFTSLGSLCSFRCMLLFGVRISRIYAPFTVGVSKQNFYVFFSK